MLRKTKLYRYNIMKRKFFQILLMGAVTVSLGLFVSCKDTSEDLYKDLELRIDKNASLDQVKQLLADEMEKMQAELQLKLDAIKQCKCNLPEGLDAGALLTDLDKFLKSMDQTTAASEDAWMKSMKDLVDNYTTIMNFVNVVGVSETELQAAIDELERKIAEIKKCDCDLSLYATIASVNAVSDVANRADKNATDALTLARNVETIANNAATAAQEAKDAAGTAQSTADAAKKLAHDADSIAKAAEQWIKDNKEQLEQNTTNIQNNITSIKNIWNRLGTTGDSLKAAYDSAAVAYALAYDDSVKIVKLDSMANAHHDILESLSNTVGTLTGTTIPGMQNSINKLQDNVDSICLVTDTLKDEIIKLYKYADQTLEKAQAYTDLEVALVRADLNGIQLSLQDLDIKVFNLGEDLKGVADDLDQFKNGVTADINDIKDAITQINDTIGKLDNRIDESELKISQLDGKLTNVQTELKNLIDGLQTQVTDLKTQVDKNTAKIDELSGELKDLQEALKKMVTSIVINETYNPAYGTFKLPAGVQSNVLLAYYGKATSNIVFPTYHTANYVEEKYALTQKDLQMLGGEQEAIFKTGDVIMQKEEGNAGTLYLTVNPNTVDFSQLQLSLVNSQDQESEIKLGALKKSDKVLQLGFSRAADDNGFYECSATLPSDKINDVQKVRVDLSTLKDDIKEIMNKRTAADFKGIASDMVDVIKGLRLDANAVKCEWEDTDSAKTKHSVRSNYDLAATAVKPLSLTTMYGADYKKVPGYDRIMSFLDRISSEAKDRVHVVFKELNGSALVEKIVNLKIKNIEVPDLSPDLLEEFILHMDTTFVMDGLTYHLNMPVDVEIPVRFEKDLEIPIHMNGVEVSVPVKIDKDVTVDMTNVSFTSPIVVVTGNASGSGKTTDPVTGELVSVLVVPVKNDVGVTVGYTEIPLDQIVVNTEITASGGLKDGETIKINGSPVAKVEIHENYTGSVDIDTVLTYHLVVEDTFKKTITLDKVFNFGDNGGTTKTFNLVFKYDMTKSAKDLWGVAQDALNDINDGLLADIRDIIDEVNNALNQINGYEDKIDTTIDTYMDKVEAYLKKANKKIVDFVNNTNSRLQPTLIASDGTGTKMLSQAKNYPTVLKAGGVSFVPTTWTLELVVPIAKKHVAVTNVFKGNKSAQGNDSNCKSELERVNGGMNMNTVFSGDIRRAYANLASGYTYEVAYSALDFHGKIATRKYYITIK